MEPRDGDPDTIGEIEFLARSSARVRLLETLQRRGPMGRAELRNHLDCSRTTVQRNLDALQEHGWVIESDRTYRLNPAGELVADSFGDLRDTIRLSWKMLPFADVGLVDRHDVDLAIIRDADVVVADKRDPYAPFDRHVERVETATDVRMLLPAVGVRVMEAIRRRATDGELDRCELVVDPDVYELLESEEKYSGSLEELLEHDAGVSVAATHVPFYLGIIDDVVQVGVEDGNGMPHALLETDAGELATWAQSVFSEFERDAKLLSPPAT